MSLVRRVTVESKPSVKGERSNCVQDQEARLMDGRATEDEIGSVLSSSNGDYSGGKQVPPQSISGRVTSPPNAGGLRVQSGYSFESFS